MPIRLGPWGRASSLSPWSNAAQLIVEAGRQQGEAMSNLGQAIGGSLAGVGKRRRDRADRAEDMALEREKFDFLKENSRADNDRASAQLLASMLEAKTTEIDQAQMNAAMGDPDAAEKVKKAGQDAERIRSSLNSVMGRVAPQPGGT